MTRKEQARPRVSISGLAAVALCATLSLSPCSSFAADTRRADEYGNLDGWEISCEGEKSDDGRTCCLYRWGSLDSAVVYLKSNGKMFVTVGNDHFPGTDMEIRVDGGRPFRSSGREWFAGGTAKSIVHAMKAGNKAVTRFREWPYNHDKDRELSLSGFTAGMRELERRVSR